MKFLCTPQALVRAVSILVLCFAATGGHAATYTERISATNVFTASLLWTGSRAPGEEESKSLWFLIEGSASREMMEEFLWHYSASPWAPSLRANLAIEHRREGRYTLALKEWEQTWSEVKDDPSASARSVAELTAAHWSQLLASLGRTEALAALFQQTKSWNWQNTEWHDLFRQSADGYYTMLHYPEVSYRCGTFALVNLANEWQHTNRGAMKLITVPSPTNGFPMSKLVELAVTNSLDLVPVERSNGSTQLVVPSVIHWRQNHYAAILRRHDSLYLVADPTFGRAHWMRGEIINEEASGKFLVPATNVPSGWRLLAKADTESVFGKGQPATIRDWSDRGCDRAPGGPGAPVTSLLSMNAGGNQSVCKKCLGGMAHWWVSEPYCNLFISDEPLSYTLSDGTEWSFRWTLKQRDYYDIPWLPSISLNNPDGRLTGMTNASLTHNWLSCIVVRDVTFDDHCVSLHKPDYQLYEGVVFQADGGVQEFDSYLAQADGRSQVKVEPLSPSGHPTFTNTVVTTNGVYDVGNSTDGFRLSYPDGSQDIYNLIVDQIPICPGTGNQNSSIRAFLSKRIDAQGRTNLILYSTGFFRIKYVVDFDGRTNEFSYANTNSTRLTQVKGPYGRTATFSYDSSGRLTNSTDPAGLVSQIAYTSTNSGLVTNLFTPYGTNKFSIYEASSIDGTNVLDQGNAGGHDRINRFIAIDEPDGGHQAYMYRYDSGSLFPTSYPTNEVPAVPGSTFDNGGSGTAGIQFRNSFYWGKKQLAWWTFSFPISRGSLSSQDYTNARVRHWLDAGADPNDMTSLTRLVSDRISIERAPSPDGITLGQKTWYDYAWKPANYSTGDPLISTIATVLPDGSTRYATYDYGSSPPAPYVRSQVSTYSSSSGIALRTNSYTYAANGVDLTAHTFPDGAVERFVWNTNHQMLFHTNAAREVTAFVWGGTKLGSITRPNGFGTGFGYYTSGADFGKLQTISESQIGRTITFTWTNDNPLTITDERGLTVTNSWDALNRLTGTRYPDGTFTSNRYDKLDLFATKDRLGNWTYFGHDRLQRLTVVTNANTNKTWFAYCGCGSLEAVTNALGETNIFTYDFQLRRTSMMLSDGSSVSYHYDPLGQLTSIADGANRTWTLTYNNQGLLAAVSNAFGQVQRIVYDIRDRPVQVTDAAGVTITNTFDAVSRLLARTYPDNGVERFFYGTNGTGLGQLIFYTNQLGAPTIYGYDVAGRLNAITNANTEVTRFIFTNANDLLFLVDAKLQTNKWNYNLFGLVTNKVNANGVTNFAFAYDANNRLTNRWTPAKGNMGLVYDPMDNVLGVTYSNSAPITFAYDALNRPQQMNDAVGQTVFTYTRAGQLASEDGPWSNDTVTNVYSQLLRTSSTLGNTWTNSYGYDDARRLNSLASGAGTFSFQFVGASHLMNRVGLPNTAFITNVFDNMAQLTNTALLNSSLAILNAHSYLLDQWGQRYFARREDGTRWEYAHDAIGQLKTALPYDANNNLITAQRLGYGYDAANNLSYRTNDMALRSFATDKLNELTNVSFASLLTVSGVTTTNATNVTVNGITATLNGDGTYSATVPTGNGTNTLTAIGYERYGRRATSTVSVASSTLQYDANQNMLFDGKRGYGYDDENQLTNIVVTNQWKTDFVLDGFGRRRIRKEYTWSGGAWSLTNEVRYVFDGLLAIQERDSNNVVKITYTRGLDFGGGMQGAGGIGGLLARTDGGSSAYYHADGNGNITALIDSSQSLAGRYSFDPFGNLLTMTGTLAPLNAFQFSSKENYRGVTLFEARPYLANLQRFGQADPIGIDAGWNLHAFVINDPINAIDPFGLELGLVPSDYVDNPEYREGFNQGVMYPLKKAWGALNWALDELDDFSQWLRGTDNPFFQRAGTMMQWIPYIDGAGEVRGGLKGARKLQECEKAVEKGKKFSKATKDEAKALNREKNGGVLRSDKSGEELVLGKKHEKGVTPPDNEAHVDHIVPRSKGGDNSIDNAQILSRKENLRKSNK